MSYKINDPELRERFEAHKAAGITSVRDEMLLMRTFIEDRMNLCRTEAERIAFFKVYPTAVAALDKLANSIAKLEQNASISLTKDAARTLAVDIGKILIEELNDIPNRDTIIDKVSRRIASAVMDARNAAA